MPNETPVAKNVVEKKNEAPTRSKSETVAVMLALKVDMKDAKQKESMLKLLDSDEYQSLRKDALGLCDNNLIFNQINPQWGGEGTKEDSPEIYALGEEIFLGLASGELAKRAQEWQKKKSELATITDETERTKKEAALAKSTSIDLQDFLQPFQEGVEDAHSTDRSLNRDKMYLPSKEVMQAKAAGELMGKLVRDTRGTASYDGYLNSYASAAFYDPKNPKQEGAKQLNSQKIATNEQRQAVLTEQLPWLAPVLARLEGFRSGDPLKPFQQIGVTPDAEAVKQSTVEGRALRDTREQRKNEESAAKQARETEGRKRDRNLEKEADSQKELKIQVFNLEEAGKRIQKELVDATKKVDALNEKISVQEEKKTTVEKNPPKGLFGGVKKEELTKQLTPINEELTKLGQDKTKLDSALASIQGRADHVKQELTVTNKKISESVERMKQLNR
ncbi:hypothetical protein EXS71_01625 [Candidatus Uhrbacteria bacterium]|nr:hypothetical protein [Candidatus Uhrbacteria bacterium]